MVTWKRFDQQGNLEVKEFYDPQYEHWPIKVIDTSTGMVTWKRFDKQFNLEVKEFYAPELHDPESKRRLSWAFFYRPQPQPPAANIGIKASKPSQPTLA